MIFVSLRGCAPAARQSSAMDPNPCNYICLVAATVARAEESEDAARVRSCEPRHNCE